jgi:hypothetical protein
MKDAKSFPESEMFPTPTQWWADQPAASTRIGWTKGGVYDGHYFNIRRHTDCERHDDGTFVSESWERFNLPQLTDREIKVFREWMKISRAQYGRFYGSDESNWDDVTWFIVPNGVLTHRFDWDHERHPLEAFVGNTYEGEMYRRGAVLDLNLVEMYDEYPVIGLSYSGWYQHLAMANFLHNLADFDTRGSRRWRTHARTFEDRVIWLAFPKGTWRCRPFVDDSKDSIGWWNFPRRVTTPIGENGAHRIDGFPDGLPREEWLICYEGFFCFDDGRGSEHTNTKDDARIEYRNALGFDSDEAYLAGREAITKRQRKAAGKVAA